MNRIYALFPIMLAAAGQAQVTHELQVEDDEFNPPSLTINPGDHVHIFWDNSVVHDHNVTEVSQATWAVNGTAPLAGGYQMGVGTASPGTDFTITPTETVWYVCTFHAGMGMKGVINVAGGTGIAENASNATFALAPNPSHGSVTVMSPVSGPLRVQLYDATGRMSAAVTLTGDRTIDTSGMVEGVYFVLISAMDGTRLACQRLVVEG